MVKKGEDWMSDQSLHQMARGLPTYLLFETTCGYALFLAEGIQEIKIDHGYKGYKGVENYILRCNEVFKFVSFHRFESVDETINELDKIYEGQVSHKLMTFLAQSLPEPMNGNKPCFLLCVADTRMINPIVDGTRIMCTANKVYTEVMRGLRIHIDKLIPGVNPEEFAKARLDMTHLHS